MLIQKVVLENGVELTTGALIGEGAMGKVYATHITNGNEICVEGKDYVLKVLDFGDKVRSIDTDRAIKRFNREARTLEMVFNDQNHPRRNVLGAHFLVASYGVGEVTESRLPCLLMEYIDGSTLYDVVLPNKAT